MSRLASIQLDSIIQRLNREAIIWRRASHRYVLEFYGVYKLDTRIALVSPWLDNGTVHEYLGNESRKRDLRLLLTLVSTIVDVPSLGCRSHQLNPLRVLHRDVKGETNLRRARTSAFYGDCPR
jgi:serine/threonine protein kinase